MGGAGARAWRIARHVQWRAWDGEVVAYHLGYLVEKVYEFKKAVKSSIMKEAKIGNAKRRAKSKAASKRRNR